MRSRQHLTSLGSIALRAGRAKGVMRSMIKKVGEVVRKSMGRVACYESALLESRD